MSEVSNLLRSIQNFLLIYQSKNTNFLSIIDHLQQLLPVLFVQDVFLESSLNGTVQVLKSSLITFMKVKLSLVQKGCLRYMRNNLTKVLHSRNQMKVKQESIIKRISSREGAQAHLHKCLNSKLNLSLLIIHRQIHLMSQRKCK